MRVPPLAPLRRPGWAGRAGVWLRRASLGLAAAGAALVLLGAAGLVAYELTPPVMLEHGDPHRGGDSPLNTLLQTLGPTQLDAISPYARAMPVAARPLQPRVGLWIEIPSLGISLPIREGDGSNRIPQWVALHYPGTAEPGSPGSSYLYAHGLWGMFGGLLYARVGDTVLLHDYSSGRLETFHVTRVIGRVRYDDMAWVEYRSSRPVLILQTCVDYDLKGDRFLVQAS